jgi:hypothetical protein
MRKSSMSEWFVAIYVTGIAIGVIVMRDRWPERVVTAVAWPLGLLAFGVVVVIQVIAAMYLWPIPMLATIGLFIGVWYIL